MLALAPETTCGSRDCGFLRPLLASWKLVPVREHLHVCRQGTGTSLATRAPRHRDTQQGSGGMGWRRWGWRWWEGSVGAHCPTEGPVVVVSWTIRAQGQGCKTSQKIWNKTQAGPCGDIPTRPTTKGSRLASNVIAVSHPCSQSRLGMRWEMVKKQIHWGSSGCQVARDDFGSSPPRGSIRPPSRHPAQGSALCQHSWPRGPNRELIWL